VPCPKADADKKTMIAAVREIRNMRSAENKRAYIVSPLRVSKLPSRRAAARFRSSITTNGEIPLLRGAQPTEASVARDGTRSACEGCAYEGRNSGERVYKSRTFLRSVDRKRPRANRPVDCWAMHRCKRQRGIRTLRDSG